MRSNTMPANRFPLSLRRLLRWAALAAALLAPAAWAAPFTVDAANGTVTDAATGLMWDRCPWGQSGADCATGSATPSDWAQALAAAQTANAAPGYKGYTDWRLPNKNELESLVKIDGATAPFIDTAFPGTPASGNPSVFWSSTTYAPIPANAWHVNFGNGDTFAGFKTNAYAVRLVRSGQFFAFFDALADTTPPAITSGPTATPGSDGTTASVAVTVDEAATGFWLVQPAADTPPNASTLPATGQQVALAASTEATINLTSLTPGTAYTLYFIARDAAGNAGSVASVAFTTPVPTAPGTPTNATATPGNTQATVSWTAPTDTGGGITQYTVTAPGTAGCTATPPTTSCIVPGLTNGQTYTFSVQAENTAGQSAPAQTLPVTPLASGTAFSAPSPTGSGTVGVAVSGGGGTCAFERVQLLPTSSASPTPPAHVQFPHGLLDFVLAGCNQTAVTLTITYPSPLPQGVQYWKLQGSTWAPYGSATATAGTSTATLTVQDGGQGDDDGQPNGRIVDPGGVGVMAAGPAGSAAAIPTLSQWGLVLMAGLLGLFSLGALRRRG